MREILFKAKRLDNGEWVEGFLIEDINNSFYITAYNFVPMMPGHERKTTLPTVCKHKDEWVLSVDVAVFEVDPSTVCQYTGLTDKNGVKIFEWDNIIHDTKSLIEEKRFDTGTVVFDEQTAQFVRTSKDERGLFEIWKRSKDDYEVIGNIHD